MVCNDEELIAENIKVITFEPRLMETIYFYCVGPLRGINKNKNELCSLAANFELHYF